MVKRPLTQVFILKIFVLLLAFPPILAHAESREFTYQVYAGGIHAIEAKLDFTVADDIYDVSVDAKTRGWLGSVVPWEGVFKTNGAVENASFSPAEHQSISVWRGETETKTFLYKNNALSSLTIQEDNRPLERPEFDRALTNQTTDLLSATLSVMDNVVKTQKCSGEADIYDGKRRFRMFFKDGGEKILSKSRYNIFSGPARLCTIEIEPKGGKWHKKPRGWLSIQEQGRQQGALPSVWMGVVEGFRYAVPVKIMVKTDYGTLLMHLTNVK